MTERSPANKERRSGSTAAAARRNGVRPQRDAEVPTYVVEHQAESRTLGGLFSGTETQDLPAVVRLSGVATRDRRLQG
ncbi:MAG TPA: hypothetical protein VFQ54_08865, partial [Thermomicrobiales bacterium]|nr:hypothetical protein [Thermomicrobiales bacterium]